MCIGMCRVKQMQLRLWPRPPYLGKPGVLSPVKPQIEHVDGS